MKMIKQREESAGIYEGAGRAELATQERDEIVIIKGFMPEEIPAEKVRELCQSVIAETGSAGLRDMGKCMAGEGLASQHEEITDCARNDADNGAGIEGVAHEFIVKDRGHAPRSPVRHRRP